MGQYGDSYVYGSYEYCLQNRPPPLQLYGIAGEDVFLHGYVTVYVSSYYVSLVVSYYDATAVLDVDALLSFLRHVSFYQCINICIYTFISFIFCVVFY